MLQASLHHGALSCLKLSFEVIHWSAIKGQAAEELSRLPATEEDCTRIDQNEMFVIVSVVTGWAEMRKCVPKPLAPLKNSMIMNLAPLSQNYQPWAL